MKFEEYLKDCNISRLKDINEYWCCCPQDGTLVKGFYIREILRILVRCSKFESVFTCKYDEEKLSYKEREYLKKSAVGVNLNIDNYQDKLNKIGIMHGSRVFEEFEKVIVELMRKNIREFNEYKIKVIPTPFLKLILIINYLIHENTLDCDEILNRVNFKLDDKLRDIIRNYLYGKGFIVGDKHQVRINNGRINSWVKSRYLSIKDFYEYVFSEFKVVNVWGFLRSITKIIFNSNEAININELKWFIDYYKNEVILLEELGLLIIDYKQNLIKLCPECWYLSTGREPISWSSNQITITPDFEVFMPFNSNPFIIGVVDYFSEIKKGKDKKVVPYNNDFFIISDIRTAKQVSQDIYEYNDVESSLRDNCDNIPDVVTELLFSN